MSEPTKILFVGLCMGAQPPLSSIRELNTLRKGLDEEHWLLVERWNPSAGELSALLLEHEPQLVHFSGHGSEDAQLYLPGLEGGFELVDGEALAKLLSVPGVRCVVLNSCHSRELARVLCRHVDAVLGVEGEVEERDAIAFTLGLYAALCRGQDLQTAFELGRLMPRLSAGSAEQGFELHLREGIDAACLRFHEPGVVLEPDWLADLRRGLERTLSAPALSGLPPAELREGVGIEELFVGPLLERCGRGPRSGLNLCPHFHDGLIRGRLIRFEDFEQVWSGQFERPRGLEFETERVVVRGGAGSGKSTLVRVLATRALRRGGPLPLLMRARDWAEGGGLGILDHIGGEMRRVLGMASLRVEQLELLCATGAVQLLVDGFDELPSARAQERLRDCLHALAQRFTRVSMLVTSRLGYASGSKLGLQGFVELRLTPFREPQLRAFADIWGERVYGSSAQRLWEALEAEPHAMHLARVPLFAVLLAFIHARGGKLPARRSQLYARCIELLLVDWPEQGMRTLPEASGSHMCPVLEQLALSVQSARDDHFAALFGFSRVSLTREGLGERVGKGLERSHPQLELGDRLNLQRAWVRWLLEESGLLYERDTGRYEFTHLSMVEYLAAGAAARRHAEGAPAALIEFIRERHEYPIWRNTLLFLLDQRWAGALPRATFEALLGGQPNSDTVSFLLVMLREGHAIPEALCLRLFEVCIDEHFEWSLIDRFFGEILDEGTHTEMLRRWLTQRLASERGLRLVRLLRCMPPQIEALPQLQQRSVESLDPFVLLDHEDGNRSLRGQLYRGLACIPNRVRLRWAFGRSVHEVFARARGALTKPSIGAPEHWRPRWIPALLSRAAWLSSQADEGLPATRWALGGLNHTVCTRPAYVCRCTCPEQRLHTQERSAPTVEGHSFTVVADHDYLGELWAPSTQASPAQLARTVVRALPAESYPRPDLEDVRASCERLPEWNLVWVECGGPGRAAGQSCVECIDELLVGTARALAIVAEVHAASRGPEPQRARELLVTRLLHLALLWDLGESSGDAALSGWGKASVEDQALVLVLVLAQFQTTWTWPDSPVWREQILGQTPDDGLVAYLWHVCRHVGGIGEDDEMTRADAALERGVEPELARALRAYRFERAAGDT